MPRRRPVGVAALSFAQPSRRFLQAGPCAVQRGGRDYTHHGGANRHSPARPGDAGFRDPQAAGGRRQGPSLAYPDAHAPHHAAVARAGRRHDVQ